MRLLIQIGYAKSHGYRKEGQLVQAWVNDAECSWQDGSGKYLTSRADGAKGILWYLWQGYVSSDDIIKLAVKTSLVGIGKDENRTFEAIYSVDPKSTVREIVIPNVGKKGYPLIKGKVVEIGAVSEKDKREASIEEFLRGDFD